MTLPSLDYQRGRETGVAAERHWWISKLKELADDWREESDYHMQETNEPMIASTLASTAKEIDALLAERP